MNQLRVEHSSYDPYVEIVHQLLGTTVALLNWSVSATLFNFQ